MRVRQQTPETRRPEYYHEAGAPQPRYSSPSQQASMGSRNQPIKLEEPEFEEYHH
ncbi:hypothetical protein M407DRAFT_244384 [Tulasnella calospora MUT 4182]|uniref:Uncharacterized protein n=1 Tax=Tulasnella calospora MUT 4182 TaxID=1051891 RepID=A0A0C3LT86_9AGAM|nr:hypothetical protein M407DRAFT_244384 [Tulasnella calospora MUT 4182]